MNRKLLFLFFIICCNNNPVFAQLDNYKNKLSEYRYTKYLDSSKFYFAKALPLSLKKKDSVTIFMLYKNLGDAYEHHQQLDKTLSLYAVCENYIPSKNLRLRSFLLNDTAFTYTLLHNYDQATVLTLKALEVAENAGNQKEIAAASVSVAEGFSNLKLNEQADVYFKKAVAIAKKLNSNVTLEYAYRYYAVHLLKVKKPDQAIQNLKIAAKYASKLKDSISLAYNYQQQSIYQFQKKQFEKCFLFGKKAEVIWENRAENRDLSAICAQMGKYYLYLKNFLNAEFYLKKSERYLVEDLYFNQELFSDLSKLYLQTQKKDLAFDYLLKSKKCIEQINENESKSKVASLQIQFETKKKEAEIVKQKSQKEQALLNVEKSNSRFWILFVFICFLALAVLLSIIVLKKIKLTNKQLFESNASLEKMANQKKILLREIHHRVKNNLTTLKSLFYLQAKSSENTDLKNVLKECELRIDSMALIHQSLYENGESGDVDFDIFISNLFDSLRTTYHIKSSSIDIETKIQSKSIKLSHGIYLGLIINELATNSFKYAFPNDIPGKINLKLKSKNNVIKLTYSDSGVGIENFENQKQGFGLKLIAIMIDQLNGKLTYSQNTGLSKFEITCPDV